MRKRYFWIGLAIGLFFAGLVIGYIVFINTFNPYSMMMGYQQFTGSHVGYIVQNPEYMNQWMSQNPQLTYELMNSMMQDPQLRLQIYDHMFQNKDFLNELTGNACDKKLICSTNNASSIQPNNYEPAYKVMNSIEGVTIHHVSIVDDNTVLVQIEQVGGTHPNIQKIIVTNDGGDLVGSESINAGWQGTFSVKVKLVGTGSVYQYQELRLFLIPYSN